MGMKIIMFGKPGAGKGTQESKFLEGREDRFEIFSTGNILRKEINDHTPIGKRAKIYMDAGNLVPDAIIIKMMIERIKKSDKNVFLDGFPRTKEQAEAMLKAGIIPDLVIELEIDDEVVIERAKNRLVCSKCGEPYTTSNFKRPKNEGFCDKCGGKLGKRPDDNEEVVKSRLKVFEKETYPVLEVFKKNGIIINKIDATSEKVSELLEILILS